MTAADLTKLFAVMQPGDRALVAAALADWQGVIDRHGDPGMFALALFTATMLHAAVPATEEVAA